MSLGYLDNVEPTISIFSKVDKEDNFSRLIKGFAFPKSGEEAVKMYAEAAKNRNGVIQYALLSDVLRAEKYNDYSGLNFVTGVSSPWIDSYNVTKIDDNHFDIVFTYRTSVPADSFENQVKISTGEKNEYWVITSLK